MLKIYLTRHGQSQDNASGVFNRRTGNGLTKLGEDQALELARKIADLDIVFDAVYTSPLTRSKVTTDIITKFLKLPKPKVMPDLIERDFGELEGKDIADSEKLFTKTLNMGTSLYCLEGPKTESFPDVLKRAKKFLKEIKTRHQNGNILVVCHGEIGRMIFASYYKIKWLEVLKLLRFGNCELVLLSNIPPDKAKLISEKQYNA